MSEAAANVHVARVSGVITVPPEKKDERTTKTVDTDRMTTRLDAVMMVLFLSLILWSWNGALSSSPVYWDPRVLS